MEENNSKGAINSTFQAKHPNNFIKKEKQKE